MCRQALDKLAQDGGTLKARALAHVARWEANGSCGHSYVRRWRELLDMPLDATRQIVLADTDEGQALRANNPFPGFFGTAERRSLRDASLR